MKYQDLQESSLSRLWSETEKHAFGAITDYRGENTTEENQENNRILVNYLQGKGYSLTRVDGSYIENFNTPTAREVREPSHFVCNHTVEGDDGGQLETDLRKLGARFDQDSVLIVPAGVEGAYLVGTSDRSDAWPAPDQKAPAGSAKWGYSLGPFFSRVGGRKFVFEEIQPPSTRNARWAQYLLTKQIDEDLLP